MPIPADPYNFVNGVTAVDGDQLDARFLPLYRTLDPAQIGIDDSNIKALGVGTASLAALAVTTPKLADAAVTSPKLKPSAGLVAATSSLTCSGSFADVPGATLTITPDVASVLLVVAVFDASTSNTGPGQGTISVDGVDQPAWGSRGAASGTFSQNYAVALSAAAHTIKMRGKLTSGTVILNSVSTNMLYMLLAA